jgi:hypothetical protein
MRVFVASTLTRLAELHRSGRLAVDDGSAFAVTPALREWYADSAAEELDYAALTEAAGASVGMLASDPDAPPRRVVVAADVTAALPDTSHGRAGVRLAEPVLLHQVASVHVDAIDAEETVRRAIDAAPAAAAGDDDAAAAVEEPEGFELMWYATQELPDLLHT